MLHQTTRTRFFRQRTIWALLLIVALLLSAASVAVAVTPPAEPDAPAAPDAAPFLWTDKADYQPEEIVHAGGANFLPGAYAVPVLRPDGTIVKGDGSFAPGYDLALVPPGSLTFTYDYTLDGIVGRYELRVYAEGVPVPATAAEWAADLNYVASVSFTDAASLKITKSASPATYTAAGQVINYSYVLLNNGTTTLNGPFAVYDDKAPAVSCPVAPTLSVGASLTCSASYTTLASDMSFGFVANKAYAIRRSDHFQHGHRGRLDPAGRVRYRY